MKDSYSTKKVKQEFAQKRRLNPRYSLRAFARDLRISPSTLSRVLNGERSIPTGNRKAIAKRLRLSASESQRFIEDNAEMERGQVLKVILREERYATVIAEWEHYAVLSLLRISDFEPSEKFIARRLGLTLERAKEVVRNLASVGLLKIEGGQWERIARPVGTTDNEQSRALRQSHAENLILARDCLDTVPTELRDFLSSTFAISIADLPGIKELARKFLDGISQIVDRSGQPSEVYQLGIQIFPLTKMSVIQNKKEVEK